jgi:hypothetical protein
MNKSNMLAILGLVLAAGAVTYAAMSPIVMAFQQDVNMRAYDGGTGQNGADGTRGHSGLAAPDSRGRDGADGPDGRGFSVQVEVR